MLTTTRSKPATVSRVGSTTSGLGNNSPVASDGSHGGGSGDGLGDDLDVAYAGLSEEAHQRPPQHALAAEATELLGGAFARSLAAPCRDHDHVRPHSCAHPVID